MCLEEECARNQLENMGIRQLIGLDTTKVSDGIGLVSALKWITVDSTGYWHLFAGNERMRHLCSP